MNKSDELWPDTEIEILDAAEARFVSRGGLKLASALADCRVNVQGLSCLDVGQSTGGFTDCLLQSGAASVVGVDVGRDQLHATLRADPRVHAVEGVNLRHEDAIKLIASTSIDAATKCQKGFDLIVGDVSFISQTLLAPVIAQLLAPTGQIVMLVKPQFELQPGAISRGGLVKDDSLFDQVRERVCGAWQVLGMQVLHYLPSAINGGDGNREFFIHLGVRHEQ